MGRDQGEARQLVLSQGWEQAISEFVLYMAASAMATRSIALREKYLRRLGREHPQIDNPFLITPVMLLTWFSTHTWAPETKRSVRSSLVNFYAWAVDYGITETNPAAKLPHVKVPRALPRPTPEKVVRQALIDVSDRDRLMVLLGAQAGLRRGEIAGLPWSSVTDLGLHIIGKGGAERLVPFSEQLATELNAEAERRIAGDSGSGWRFSIDPHSPFVFPGARGVDHMHPDSVGPILTQLLGGGPWTAHTLRHRFATMAHAGTGDIRAVQELLGHASLATTMRYVQVNLKQLKAAVDAAA